MQDNGERGELTYRVIAMPADTNASGDIFGGWLMSQADLAGSLTYRLEAVYPGQPDTPLENVLAIFEEATGERHM